MDEQDLEWHNRFLYTLESLPGYAGVEWREGEREHAVYATSGPNDEVLKLIDQAPKGISVTWHSAPFAFAELDAEVHRLMDEHLTIVAGAANGDGTGIWFGTVDPELGSAPDPGEMLGAKFPVTVEYSPHRPMPA